MRIDAIDIEEHILDKIETKHGVTFEECEEVVFSRARRVRRSKRELFKVFGGRARVDTCSSSSRPVTCRTGGW